MELVHGGAQELHVGICLTDDDVAAENYAAKNLADTILIVEIDLAGLVVANVENADTDDRGDYVAPGDDGDTRGADILVYLDTDEHGRTHSTWRLMTAAAVTAATIAATWDIAA